MKFSSKEEIQRRELNALGFDQWDSSDSTGIIRTMMLRGLWSWAPCTRASAISNIRRTLNIFDDGFTDPQLLSDVIDDLIDQGQIKELRSRILYSDRPTRTLFVQPPSYFVLESGSMIVTGFGKGSLAPNADLVFELGRKVGDLVLVDAPSAKHALEELESIGIKETSMSSWVSQPQQVDASTRVSHASNVAGASKSVKSIDGLRLIDPDSDPTYYPGRWTMDPSEVARSIGRRTQAYGADLWVYFESHPDGFKFVDLPTRNEFNEGRDEAWLIQMALDYENQNPQKLRITEEQGSVQLSVFSPLPGWIERRWTVLGTKNHPQHALFGYAFTGDLGFGEADFASRNLYLEMI